MFLNISYNLAKKVSKNSDIDFRPSSTLIFIDGVHFCMLSLLVADWSEILKPGL